jgi:hypothetical protein
LDFILIADLPYKFRTPFWAGGAVAEDWSQGLKHARQVLYLLATSQPLSIKLFLKLDDYSSIFIKVSYPF